MKAPLHCLANDARGGDSLLVDGFRLAVCLAEEEPALYEALTSIPVDFNSTDWETDYRWRSPIIRLGAGGTPVEIRFGTFLRGPFDPPTDQMAQFYRAYRRFSALTRDPRFLVRLRLEPGDLMAFDNRRALHARTAFEPSTGQRHLRGCYIDRDEVLSRIRVLQRQFPPTDRTGFVRQILIDDRANLRARAPKTTSLRCQGGGVPTIWLVLVTLLWFTGGVIVTRRYALTGELGRWMAVFSGIGVAVGLAYSFYVRPMLGDEATLGLWIQGAVALVIGLFIVERRIWPVRERMAGLRRMGLGVVGLWLQSLLAILVTFACASAVLFWATHRGWIEPISGT